MENGRRYAEETPLLEVRGISKQYKGFLLDKVSFTLPKGYIMGYVGPNGAGKSTTLGIITQTRRAAEGEVLLDGMTYADDPVLYKEKIGYVSSVSYFPPVMKIKDAAMLFRQFYPTFSGEKFFRLVREALTENYILVKGDEALLAKTDAAKYLIGTSRAAYGFSALVRTDNAASLPAGIVMEKPAISQIMSYLLKDGRMMEK